LVEGLKFARRVNAALASRGLRIREIWPSSGYASDEEFIRREAWGHHACGTCRIGRRDDPTAMLDSDFPVHGVDGLRVVDASVFPRIPGFFIALSIYMVAEKASDVFLQSAGS
jgi:choline dehydrogenase